MTFKKLLLEDISFFIVRKLQTRVTPLNFGLFNLVKLRPLFNFLSFHNLIKTFQDNRMTLLIQGYAS